jgi:hypothetical protein
VIEAIVNQEDLAAFAEVCAILANPDYSRISEVGAQYHLVAPQKLTHGIRKRALELEPHEVILLPNKGVPGEIASRYSLLLTLELRQSQLKLRVLYSPKPGNGNQAHSIGFRFEPDDPPHGHYHIQVIESLLPHEGDSRLPTTHPTFPAPAGDWFELFVCFLVSVYGPLKDSWLVDELKGFGRRDRLLLAGGKVLRGSAGG